MKTGWDAGQELADATGGGGTFFKLENNEDGALVVFVGEIAVFRAIFREGEGSLDADSPEGIAYSEINPGADRDARFRARFGVVPLVRNWDPEYKKLVASDDSDIEKLEDALHQLSAKDMPEKSSIFEHGKVFFGDAKKMNGRKPFDTWVYEIERQGAKGDKKTKYRMFPVERISEVKGLAELIASVEIRDAANPFDDDQPTETSKPKKPDVKALTRDQMNKVKAALKAAAKEHKLDNDGSDALKAALYQKFGVSKISEMPTEKFDDLLAAFPDAIQSVVGEDDAAPDEKDPFDDI